MIRKTIATAAISAALILTSCSSNTSTSPTAQPTSTTTPRAAVSTTTTPPASTTQPARSTEKSAQSPTTPNYEPSQAQITAFTTAFRTQFPALSTGRRDKSIASVLENSCQEISVGKNEQNLLRNASMCAAYQDTIPTEEQTAEILALVRAHCPAT
ncbi:hypothetical protein [Rhodococcus rhodochrous]|uniref:hypothetical protein n=1 Tax=Rhodococcus rhodochrous TaxID=1829 RepID=UPI0011A25675|nr:hypothetical protein [Rhodococcus rhodochrous]